MSTLEAAIEIRNQSPALALAYLWTFLAFMGFCVIMGIRETLIHRKGK